RRPLRRFGRQEPVRHRPDTAGRHRPAPVRLHPDRGQGARAAHPGTQTFRQFREYRAAFCQLLGIPDEKALGLLHKIQSAKELGDVNALLRDYMLDAPRTFDLADQALANFQNLSEVYEALVTAREQRDLLRGLREAHEGWTAMRERGGALV